MDRLMRSGSIDRRQIKDDEAASLRALARLIVEYARNTCINNGLLNVGRLPSYCVKFSLQWLIYPNNNKSSQRAK